MGLIGCAIFAGNFQTAPTIFFLYFQDIFLIDFIKNPQTRNAQAFLPLDISTVGPKFSKLKSSLLLVTSRYVKWEFPVLGILILFKSSKRDNKLQNLDTVTLVATEQ